MPQFEGFRKKMLIALRAIKILGKIIIAFETYHPGGTQNGLFCRGGANIKHFGGQSLGGKHFEL